MWQAEEGEGKSEKERGSFGRGELVFSLPPPPPFDACHAGNILTSEELDPNGSFSFWRGAFNRRLLC